MIPQKEKILKSSLQEINRLNTLTANILVSAQLEGGSYLFNKEEIDFSQIVADSAQDFGKPFPQPAMEQNTGTGFIYFG